MQAHSVEKVGGTSIAATDVLLNNVLIGARRGEALYNRIFVVSAFSGITDRLLEHKKSGTAGVYVLFAKARVVGGEAWRDALARTQIEMCAVNARTFIAQESRQEADAFVAQRMREARDCLTDIERLCGHGHFHIDEHLRAVREMLASIGEAHSAFSLALLLKSRGIAARFVDLTGWADNRVMSLDERIAEAFDGVDPSTELPIATGYAKCREGLIGEFGRGYTEVVFSRIAALTEARAAVIHKEFHLSSADPKLVGVDAVRKIGATNYDVADQLSNIGMEAIHPRAARGLRHAGIPLQVRNTFDADDRGTTISADFISETPRVEIVAGMRNVIALEVLEQDMVGVKGYDAAILETLTAHDVRIVSKASNANTITHHLDADDSVVAQVEADLETQFPNATIAVRPVALVCVIGSDLNLPGVTARAASALTGEGVGILGVQQISRRVDIQFIIEPEDYDRAIAALHRALIEAPGAGRLAAAA